MTNESIPVRSSLDNSGEKYNCSADSNLNRTITQSNFERF